MLCEWLCQESAQNLDEAWERHFHLGGRELLKAVQSIETTVAATPRQPASVHDLSSLRRSASAAVAKTLESFYRIVVLQCESELRLPLPEGAPKRQLRPGDEWNFTEAELLSLLKKPARIIEKARVSRHRLTTL